jgi:hypothetical protein
MERLHHQRQRQTWSWYLASLMGAEASAVLMVAREGLMQSPTHSERLFSKTYRAA